MGGGRTELMPRAALRIETAYAITHCDGCGRDYDTVPQSRMCPYCGSEDTWLVQGNEVNIKEIEGAVTRRLRPRLPLTSGGAGRIMGS